MKLKSMLVLLGLGLVGLVFFLEIFQRPVLRIKTVNCQLATEACPPALQKKTQQLKNHSFLFFNLEKEIANWQLELYQLDEISKIWPQTLSLKLKSEPNLYLLKTQNEVLSVTTSGITQPETDPEDNLITITTQQKELTPELHQKIKHLVNQLKTHNISAQQIELTTDNLAKIRLNSQLTALAEPDQTQTQIAKLSLILQELDLKQIDLAIKTIDLRFELPVLKTN